MNADEILRRSWLPEQVRILFIGESPPASGRFFYRGDSGLYRAVKEAFPPTPFDFLPAFRAAGCYLTDLCPHPVDQLSPSDRKAACRQGEAALAETIQTLRPELIVVLLRSIRPHVLRAIEKAAWTGDLIVVPYPGRWKKHREEFLRVLKPLLTAKAAAA